MSRDYAVFQETVWAYYRAHGRHNLPWRQVRADGTLDPYMVLVSEIMLQQTQVPRVIPKFEAFIQKFPSFAALAVAPLSEVLIAWSGLGYNRRAKFLWQTAGIVAKDHHGKLPQTQAELSKLPGIGQNTAGAIIAYAFNRPVVFIETNIRTVFIHHFPSGEGQVSDKTIADMVASTVPDSPRLWYWALMDYGTHLKHSVGNLNKLSIVYAKQSSFVGSRRQIRGQVLRVLGASGGHTLRQLEAVVSDERLAGVLEDLAREGFIRKTEQQYQLSDVL